MQKHRLGLGLGRGVKGDGWETEPQMSALREGPRR